MKVLGISFGRKMSCTDVLVKQALMGAQQAGAEVAFVNTLNLKIERCTGCGACTRAFRQGQKGDCVIKDDFAALEEMMCEADALIVGAPVYVLQPVGQFKNLVDRFAMRHDRAKFIDKPALDPRWVKQRYISYISVGGATTRNWTSMGLLTMRLLGFSSLMHVVGTMDVYKMGKTVSPVRDEKLLADANELGTRTARAIGQAPETVEWFGEDGLCPVCHQSILSVKEDCTAECVLCGTSGKVEIKDGKLKINFTKESLAGARGTLQGQKDHVDEIADFVRYQLSMPEEEKQEIADRKEKYKDFCPEVKFKKG